MHKHRLKAERRPITLSGILWTLGLGLLVFTMLFPLIWMLSASFKLELEVFNYPIEWVTPNFSFNNYIEVLQPQYNFLLYFKNTFVITIAVVVAQIAITSIGAYAFAKMDFAGKNVLFALFLATMMIPDQVTIVPRFLMMNKIGLYDSHGGIILMLAFGVYGVFLMRQAMIAVPNTVIEAAKIDGAGHFCIFVKVAMPMCRSTVATLAIMRFVWTWNDYQTPLIFLRSKELFTLQLGMKQFADIIGTKYALLMAASMLAILPLFIIFAIGQKNVVEGIASGAVKG